VLLKKKKGAAKASEAGGAATPAKA